MKLEESVAVIECENKNERESIVSFLKENGFISVQSLLIDCCYIAVYANTKVFNIFEKNITHGGDVFYTYDQFMEEYSTKESVMNKGLMLSRIEAAKEKLGLGDSELSVKLGHNRNYISRVLHQENPSMEQMTKVVNKCNALILAKYDSQIDSEDKRASGSMAHGQSIQIADATMISLKELDELHATIAEQKKEIDHKNQVLDKRNDLYQKLELELKDKDEIKGKLDFVSKRAVDDVKNLEDQLKTTQEKFTYVVDQKDHEINDIKNQLSKKQEDFWTVTREKATLTNKSRDERVIALIIVVILTAFLIFKSL